MAYHAQSGWHFERLPDGAVRIFRIVPNSYGVAESVVIDRFTWASVVASVSANGEESGRFYRALAFHDGDS